MYKLVGYRNSEFQGDNGSTVKGVTLYLASEIDNRFGKGFSVFKQFVLSNKCPELVLNANYNCNFNRYGKLSSIEKV